MRSDSSRRTRQIRVYSAVFVVALAGLVASLGLWAAGEARYARMVGRSSSPLGSTLSFKRSDASATIRSLYTDEARSVLIVRLAVDDRSRVNLPWKGEDFTVYLASDSLDGSGLKRASVLFGFYDRDTDLFLFIPWPGDEVFDVFLMVSNFVATDVGIDVGQGGAPDASQAGEDLVRGLLLDYTPNSASQATLVRAGDDQDISGFRVTAEPALRTPDYEPVVLPGQLLGEDGSFDYERMFDAMFKSVPMADVEAEYASLEARRAPLEERVRELEGRLEANPSDAAASARLEQARSQIEQIAARLEQLAVSWTALSEVRFDPASFQDMQTEAVVISTADAETLFKITGQSREGE